MAPHPECLIGLVKKLKAAVKAERYLVVLSPTVSALEWRERQRAKEGYLHFSPGVLDEVLRRETAQIGYWLDSSAQTPDETVDDILVNLERARV